MVPLYGKWALSRSNRTPCSHGTMDIWTLSCMHKVPHVRLRCSRGISSSFLCIRSFFPFSFPLVKSCGFFRSWLLLEVTSARKEWSPFLVVVLSSTMLLSSFISGFSQLLWYLWFLGAIYIYASIGFTYTLMKPSLRSALQITKHLRVSISPWVVILKSSLLQLTRLVWLTELEK